MTPVKNPSPIEVTHWSRVSAAEFGEVDLSRSHPSNVIPGSFDVTDRDNRRWTDSNRCHQLDFMILAGAVIRDVSNEEIQADRTQANDENVPLNVYYLNRGIHVISRWHPSSGAVYHVLDTQYLRRT